MAFSRALTRITLIFLLVTVPASTATFELPADPLLIGNDGSAANGGWTAWKLESTTPLTQVHAETPERRTKLVTVVYRDDGKKKKNLVTLPDFKEVKSARFTALGDWSALCAWKAASGNDYLYLFGKKEAKLFLFSEEKGRVEIVEVLTFPIPFKPSGYTTSPSVCEMYLSADNDKDTYTKAKDDVTGLAAYASNTPRANVLFVASENKVTIYNSSSSVVGTTITRLQVLFRQRILHKQRPVPVCMLRGLVGKNCDKYICQDNCSCRGKCTGPNTCRCEKGWGGLHCSFVLVESVAETDGNGGDGDDPSLWISPTDRSLSRIITSTKSSEGVGLGVFDLSGKLLRT
ncbi:hypothetical protein QBC34DRAFT_385461 [Podospora aff. communis PSN243]|uniref:BPP domain-containing protein n=1 Tax=Podospora aff. communis PSN243 TaxID=3040156 RepID=A0AAV9GAM5_9PEZI|nr:hypothetical protein QBC34DRAFT_385461 [Podospora aff. communis PSN243]